MSKSGMSTSNLHQQPPFVNDSSPERSPLPRTLWSVLLLCWFALLLSACQNDQLPPTPEPGEVNLPFESVFLDEWGVNPNLTSEPRVLLLTALDEVAPLRTDISEEAYQALQQVDWGSEAVLAVFRGPQACSKHGVGIERLGLKNDLLLIHVQFWEPPVGVPCQEAITSPYHLVKVKQTTARLGTLQLVLRHRTVKKN